MNKAGDENRSVRNTKLKLRESLLTLMQEKPVGEITVKELTTLADVNRGTFYCHYADIYELLAALEDGFFQEFDSVINTEVIKGGIGEYLMAIFGFLGQNHTFCQVFLGPNGDRDFVERVKAAVDERCSIFWRNAAPQTSQDRFALYNAFIINGCVGVIQRWLDTGMKEQPEEIAALISIIIGSSMTKCIS